MESSNLSTQELLIKWKTISLKNPWDNNGFQSIKRISDRLDHIYKTTPHNVAKLNCFGLINDAANQCVKFRIEFLKLKMPNLASVCNLLSTSQRKRIKGSFYHSLKLWRKSGFIHGDLSPRNILIDFTTEQVYFVDWILDLESFEATPQYASKEVYLKRRTWFSDHYSADIICSELLYI